MRDSYIIGVQNTTFFTTLPDDSRFFDFLDFSARIETYVKIAWKYLKNGQKDKKSHQGVGLGF